MSLRDRENQSVQISEEEIWTKKHRYGYTYDAKSGVAIYKKYKTRVQLNEQYDLL